MREEHIVIDSSATSAVEQMAGGVDGEQFVIQYVTDDMVTEQGAVAFSAGKKKRKFSIWLTSH